MSIMPCLTIECTSIRESIQSIIYYTFIYNYLQYYFDMAKRIDPARLLITIMASHLFTLSKNLLVSAPFHKSLRFQTTCAIIQLLIGFMLLYSGFNFSQLLILISLLHLSLWSWNQHPFNGFKPYILNEQAQIQRFCSWMTLLNPRPDYIDPMFKIPVLNLQLRYLNLMASWVVDIGFVHRFPHLKWLKLSFNRIEDISQLDKFQLDELTHLDLSHNRIRNVEVFKRVTLKSIRKINLNDNNILEFDIGRTYLPPGVSLDINNLYKPIIETNLLKLSNLAADVIFFQYLPRYSSVLKYQEGFKNRNKDINQIQKYQGQYNNRFEITPTYWYWMLVGLCYVSEIAKWLQYY